MKMINLISLILVFLGGLNWTLMGLLNMDLFTMFGGGGVFTLVLYILVTVATLHLVFPKLLTHFHTA